MVFAILLGLLILRKYGFNKAIMLFSTLFFIVNTILLIVGPLYATPSIAYISMERMDLYEWLEDNVQNDEIIFSDFLNGNFIPAQTEKRVVFGHRHESKDYVIWAEQYEFVSDTGNVDTLLEQHIDYYVLDKERAYEPSSEFVEIVYENPDYRVYRLLWRKM